MNKIFYGGVLLLLDMLTVFYVSSGSSCLLHKLGCFIHTVLVFMVAFYGICHVVLGQISILHGGRVLEKFGTCPIKHTVICCHFYVVACLSMMRFV